MEIRIPLNIGASSNTYQELKSQLKQLELAIHHAQKAVDSAEKEGVEISENAFMCYEYPALDSSLKIDQHRNEIINDLTDIPENYYEELQSPELRINIE